MHISYILNKVSNSHSQSGKSGRNTKNPQYNQLIEEKNCKKSSDAWRVFVNDDKQKPCLLYIYRYIWINKNITIIYVYYIYIMYIINIIYVI